MRCVLGRLSTSIWTTFGSARAEDSKAVRTTAVFIVNMVQRTLRSTWVSARDLTCGREGF